MKYLQGAFRYYAGYDDSQNEDKKNKDVESCQLSISIYDKRSLESPINNYRPGDKKNDLHAAINNVLYTLDKLSEVVKDLDISGECVDISSE